MLTIVDSDRDDVAAFVKMIKRTTIPIGATTIGAAMTLAALEELAAAIAQGWFDGPKAGDASHNELIRRRDRIREPNVYLKLDKLATDVFVTKEDRGYQAVADMKVNIIEA